VQGSLDGVEMVVEVLTEANQESQRLLEVRLYMVLKEGYITK
jgi:hypothetical protein